MKDEEMAKEWISKNWTPYDFYDTECNIYNDDIKEDLIEAYLVGLKEGKPKWHNLRENPNDLPDTDRDVWVKREDEENCQLDNYYNDEDYIGWRTEQWDREYYKRKGDIGYPSSVIAWCELPKWED